MLLPLLFNGQVALFVLIIVCLILSLSLHEFGHAFSAKLFGDDTAERLGRLTVNPLAHIDPMGLLMVVFIGFGYAKPVPVNPRNYTSIWAQLVVALSGPLANLIIAFVALNLYLYAQQAGWENFTNPAAQTFFSVLISINLALMVFNLIPMGPLDGHYILPYFLPRKMARIYNEYNDRYGSMVFLGLVLLSVLGIPVFQYVFRVGSSLIPYLSIV